MRHRFEVNELLLTAAIYVVTLGFASEWRSFYVLTTLATFLLSVSYGTISEQNPATVVHASSAYASIAIAAAWTAFERYRRYMVYGRPFFEWEQR
ncbi:MAG: hypothetical protein ABSB35_40180 [Bryobacteraceae bacterium]